MKCWMLRLGRLPDSTWPSERLQRPSVPLLEVFQTLGLTSATVLVPSLAVFSKPLRGPRSFCDRFPPPDFHVSAPQATTAFGWQFRVVFTRVWRWRQHADALFTGGGQGPPRCKSLGVGPGGMGAGGGTIIIPRLVAPQEDQKSFFASSRALRQPKAQI